MSDWELLVPGIGLTVIGMVGVGLSYAGIAKTFLEGMHAISGLVMFVGMIFLAAGLLKGGIPTSSSAKAASAIVVGLMVAFGAFMAAVSTVPALQLFIGILLIIIAPSIVIAYSLNKKSKHTKAITLLFISASVVGMITFLVFDAITQDVNIPQEEQQEQEQREVIPLIPSGPKVEIIIPLDAAIAGNIPYDPLEITVKKGDLLVWINKDTIVHTVTSGSGFRDPDFGKLFDSGLIDAEKEYLLDTSKLDAGEYIYFCTLHPLMIGKFTIESNQEKSE